MKVQTFLADIVIGGTLPARSMILSLREEGGATMNMVISEDQARQAATAVRHAVSTKQIPALKDLEHSGGPKRAGDFLTARDLFEDAKGNQAAQLGLFASQYTVRIQGGSLVISGRQENGNDFNVEFDAFAAHAVLIAVDDCFGA